VGQFIVKRTEVTEEVPIRLTVLFVARIKSFFRLIKRVFLFWLSFHLLVTAVLFSDPYTSILSKGQLLLDSTLAF